MAGHTPGFEAAGASQRLRAFQPSRAHVNEMIAATGATVLARARWLVRNNGYAANAADAWAAHAVGEGIKPNPEAKGRKREQLLELWRYWTDEADADGRTDFYGLQRQVAHEVFVAGEVFLRFIPRPAPDLLAVPLQIQLVPSEMVPLDRSEDLPGGNAVRNGVEFDGQGRRVAYHVHRHHPGRGGGAFGAASAAETARVPAEEMIHVFDADEVGQLRGVSRLAPAVVKLFTLDAYDDAELDRKKMAAMFTAFVQRAANDEQPEERSVPDSANSGAAPAPMPLLPLTPGLIQRLGEGEEVTFSQPAESGSSFEPFQYRTLAQIAAAVRMPYAYVSGDMLKANYSNSRTSLIDFRRRMQSFQFSVLVHQLCRPIWHRWLATGDLSGALTLPAGRMARRRLRYAEWLPPRWDWIDPGRDSAAEIQQIRAGLKSRTQAIAERGYDPGQIDAEIAEDYARADALGLVLDTDGRKVSQAGLAQPQLPAPDPDAAPDSDTKDDAP
ncbi:phage portal protein [Fodinicurvata sp. EGI_FJ10296]|uniref:phage portal protein n=1 Tax=Fodinicurvata sp. EGI_FJ10296 TaxID=3231908 RepID=UPI003451F80B